MPLSWFRRWLNRQSKTAPRTRRHPFFPAPLRLFRLEDRTVLSPPFSLACTSPLTTSEGITYNLTGNFRDLDINQPHTVTVNWGDGETSSVAVPGTTAVNIPFTATHIYTDDNPTGTPTDDVPLVVTVTDSLGEFVTGTFTLTVANAAPVVTVALAATPGTVSEGQSVTVTGRFRDAGNAVAATGPGQTNDTQTVAINWGDGSTSTATITAITPLGNFSYSASHVYVDDGSSPGNGTASDTATITATITDDDTGSTSSSTTVSV